MARLGSSESAQGFVLGHQDKEILADRAEAMLAVPPWLHEMDDRARATKPERDKARSLRRKADVERRAGRTGPKPPRRYFWSQLEAARPAARQVDALFERLRGKDTP